MALNHPSSGTQNEKPAVRQWYAVQTYSGYEDVEGCAPEKLPRDADIEVYEAESGVHGPARVISLDRQRQLVYLKLDWTKLSPPAEQELGT